MSKYFVYYSDDWADLGGEGMEVFDSKELALQFIQDRMGNSPPTKEVLQRYTLIEGEKLAVTVAEKAVRLTA